MCSFLKGGGGWGETTSFLFLNNIYRYLRMTLKKEIVKCRDTNLRLIPSAFFCPTH